MDKQIRYKLKYKIKANQIQKTREKPYKLDIENYI